MSVTIGQRLKEIRHSVGKTVAKVAEDGDLNAVRVSFYEMDKGVPTIAILQKLAKGLDCTIFDIIDEPLARKKEKCIHAKKCMFYNKKLEKNESEN